MLLTLYYQDLTLEDMQYNKDCKKCKQACVYIGSAQNGFIWLCRKCNYIDWAPDFNNLK